METKRAPNKFVREEVQALKNKEHGKSYVLSDFTFRFKTIPAYKKEFKEIEVKYLYRDEIITYYCFIRSEFNNEDAMEIAKKQIRGLIKNGGITSYAKMYYHKFYN